MKRYHYILLVLFLATWVLAAINPISRGTWFAENIMVFLWVPTIIILGRHILLSNFSYSLITLFLLFHVVGAHYTYANVPFGDLINHIFHTNGNHYDRVLHFLFGLMLAYPIREFLTKIIRANTFWSYFLSFNVILSFSAVYEIFEWWGVHIVAPDVGYLFIGGNDIWDTQKDMLMAAIGSLVGILICVLIARSYNGKRLLSTKQ